MTIQLSPSSLNLFLECPHCFWLEKRKGVKRPQPYPYALNAAVDVLLKEEFDVYRKKGEPHPLLVAHKIPAKLFQNQNLLNQWRNNFEGLRYYDADLEATIFGAVDDVLEFPGGKLAPLDYKSTGSTVANIYDRFQIQMDAYTFLLEKNGFKTNRKGYLAFYIVDKGNGFIDRLPFRKELHEIDTDPTDVYQIFSDAVATLKRISPLSHSQDCKYALWLKGARNF
jgi:CRISPR/Cas system-associated exonuclease Cas4 (RecB family)